MEDKSYLDELVQYIIDNQKKRQEEAMSLSDTPKMGMPLTKKLKQENPGIPEDDITSYRDNAREDMLDFASGVAGSSPVLKVGAAVENALAKNLPRVSRFRSIVDNPIIEKIREPFRQQRSLDLADKANLESKMISDKVQKAEQIPLSPKESSVEAYNRLMEKEKALRKTASELKPEDTVTQELIEELTKLKMAE